MVGLIFFYLVLYLVFSFGIVLEFCSKQYWQELRGWGGRLSLCFLDVKMRDRLCNTLEHGR